MANKPRPIETLHIPEARFILPDGTTQMVQPALPGEYLRPGRMAYDRNVHHKKLICPHCDIRVDFNKGSGLAIAGTQINGSRPHFKKAPKQDHAADCELPLLLQNKSETEIDKNAGYRIHLNTVFFGAVDYRNPVYERTSGSHKVVANDPRLQPWEETVALPNGKMRIVKTQRESVPVKNVADIIDLMRRGELNRLKESLVVNNVVIPWKQFAILGDNRMRGLVARMLDGASHPVLMRVGFYKGVDDDLAVGEKLFYQRENNKPRFIIPHIYLDSPRVKDAFAARGQYLVLGVPRVKVDKKSGAIFLNISLKDLAFVAPYYPDQIEADGRARMKKHAHPAP